MGFIGQITPFPPTSSQMTVTGARMIIADGVAEPKQPLEHEQRNVRLSSFGFVFCYQHPHLYALKEFLVFASQLSSLSDRIPGIFITLGGLLQHSHDTLTTHDKAPQIFFRLGVNRCPSHQVPIREMPPAPRCNLATDDKAYHMAKWDRII